MNSAHPIPSHPIPSLARVVEANAARGRSIVLDLAAENRQIVDRIAFADDNPEAQ